MRRQGPLRPLDGVNQAPNLLSGTPLRPLDFVNETPRLLSGTPLRPLDGVNQAPHLLGGAPPPRTEIIYNINDALRVTAAIRQAESDALINYYKYYI